MRETATGSGVAVGLRAITGGSLLGVEAQALSISKALPQSRLTIKRGLRVVVGGGLAVGGMGMLPGCGLF